MKIAILANADIGLYKFRKELIEELCKNHIVYIILPNGEYIEQLKYLGCVFVENGLNRRGTNPIEDLKLFKRFLRILRDITPDLVLTYTIKPNVYGGLACQVLKIPYISNITGLGTSIENQGLLGFISTTLYKIGIKGAKCVFFQNENNQDFFVKKRLVSGKNRLIPGSGVNLEQHSVEPYPSEKNGIRFLFVGRIMKDKGIEELLESISSIHEARNDVTLDIVGWGDEDYSSLISKAEKNGAVIYHGMQSDVHSFYKKCHCAVLPSYHEGMANVMLEASATGRPVITTRVPGCKETFDEGITGFGCEAKDCESLIKAIKQFLSLDTLQREKMGLAAREKMEREFDRKIVIKAYLDEVESIK